MTSTSFIRVTGLKKCQPIDACADAPGPAAIAVIEIDEVLVASTAVGAEDAFELGEQRLLGVELLDDRLDRQTAAGQRAEIARRADAAEHGGALGGVDAAARDGAVEIGRDAAERARRPRPPACRSRRTGWPRLRRELGDPGAHAAGPDHGHGRGRVEGAWSSIHRSLNRARALAP